MKNAKKLIFPLLLVVTCCVVHFWRHSVASLPYLPNNCIVPLAVMTPSLLVLTFLTTLVMLKQSETPKPGLRSVFSMLAMLIPIAMTGIFFVSFLTYRYAAAMPPVIVLPDWPTGIATVIITALCITHLTGLLICRLMKEKAKAGHVIAALIGWTALNVCLFLVTV